VIMVATSRIVTSSGPSTSWRPGVRAPYQLPTDVPLR
jgi:hypothetical protein